MELVDEEVRLRPLRYSDREQIAKLANNKKIWNNLRDMLPHPYTIEDADKFLDMVKKQDPLVSFAIEYNYAFAGVIGMVPGVDVYRKGSEIGYWLGEPFWGKGIATRAVKLATKYAFEVLNFERLHAGVFETNDASKRVLEKCGYKLECIAKKAIFKNNKLMAEYKYVIFKS
jgi:[ribosomal protein S5]-alanine N-acetyltransferase